jgi:hypothetical protein
MKQLFLVGIVLLFSGCNLKSPQHYYGTENIDVAKLSMVSYSSGSIKLLEIDDEKYKGKIFEKIYLKPGMHKFRASLNWDIYGANGIVYGSLTSPKIITGCIELKENVYYKFFGGFPNDHLGKRKDVNLWILRVGIDPLNTKSLAKFLGANPEEWQDVPSCEEIGKK